MDLALLLKRAVVAHLVVESFVTAEEEVEISAIEVVIEATTVDRKSPIAMGRRFRLVTAWLLRIFLLVAAGK